MKAKYKILSIGQFKEHPFLTIGGIADMFRVTSMTIRSWQSKGLFPAANLSIDRGVDKKKQFIEGNVSLFSKDLVDKIVFLFESRGLDKITIKKDDLSLVAEIQKLFEEEKKKLTS